MPAKLEPGVLYVAEEFSTAAHLCVCGCGSKIRTPLGPAEWSLRDTAAGPTLHPSIGNWQRSCRSHYWIINGQVEWSEQWTPEQIVAGRAREQIRRERYYANLNGRRILSRLWRWVRRLFGG
jgi:hypothetical protein